MWSQGCGAPEGRTKLRESSRGSWRTAPESDFPNCSVLPGIGLRLPHWFWMAHPLEQTSRKWYTSLALGNSQCVLFAASWPKHFYIMLCSFSPPEMLVVFRRINLKEIRAENLFQCRRIPAIPFPFLFLHFFSSFPFVLVTTAFHFSWITLRACHYLKFSVYFEVLGHTLFSVRMEYMFVVKIVHWIRSGLFEEING